MIAFYTDEFVLPLPAGHRFPMKKYHMLRLELENTIPELIFRVPRAASRGELAYAHCPNYVSSVFDGTLSEEQQKAIGFPWSEAMTERSLRSVGATIEATFAAMQNGGAVNLAGGTHHAKYASGGGFCVFNDQVVAARVAQAWALAQGMREPRVLIVDLDVHQGDGTAQICKGDSSVFTFSIHGKSNYPFEKEQSDLDIELADGTCDKEYISALSKGLEQVTHAFAPDLILYVAGHDAHEADRLGRLSLTDDGIMQRNDLVFDFALSNNCPIVMSMAGGYFSDLSHLVRLQAKSIKQLLQWVRVNFSKKKTTHRNDGVNSL